MGKRAKMTDAVVLEAVSKRYRVGGAAYASLSEHVTQLFRGRAARRARVQEVAALDDVSFAVPEGETYALIGANGAGKTTALRVISRITPPSRGRVRVRGRVGALIEVGSGIHLELSGRENVWLYGSILGLARREIRERFDEIVDFSELGHVIDVPAKYYSTGMQLRLGFSIASHLEPDIFVVDEALAVGDFNFQARCVERIMALTREGTTLMFVSHNLPLVEALCRRAVMLDAGRVVAEGSAKEVLTRYIRHMEDRRLDLAVEQENFALRVRSVSCHGADGEERYRFAPGEGVEIRVRFESDAPLQRPHVVLGITDGRPGVLVECSMLDDGSAPDHVPTRWECRCIIGTLPLRPRLYQIWCDVHGEHGAGSLMDWIEVGAFRIEGPVGEGPKAVVNSAIAGALDVPYHWEIVREE